MIPHAGLALAGALGALLVPVISTPFRTGPVLPAGFRCSPLPSLLLAARGAVGMSVVALPVNPEHLATLPAWSYSNFQWSSARPKNWTSPRLGHILAKTVVIWSGVALQALPQEGSELQLRAFFLSTAVVDRQPAPDRAPCQFPAYLGPWYPVILVKTGPRHAGGDTSSISQRSW